jgi:hypothetical protein
MKLKSTLLGEHNTDCGSVRNVKNGTWDSAWAVPTYEFIKSNVLGRRGRPTNIGCIVFICNSTQCKAKLAVEDKLITSQLRKY